MTQSRTPKPRATFFRVAAGACFAVAVLIPIQAGLFALLQPPRTALAYFEVFARSPLSGLVDLDLLLTLDNLVLTLVYVALYACLRRRNPPLALTGLIFGVLSVALYVVSREATFTMMSLSMRYAATNDPIERMQLATIGETLLAVYQGSTFDISYVLGGVAVLLYAWAMRGAPAFPRWTARLGVVMSVMMLVPPTLGVVGMTVAFLSLLPTFVWLITIGTTFWKHAETLAVQVVAEE